MAPEVIAALIGLGGTILAAALARVRFKRRRVQELSGDASVHAGQDQPAAPPASPLPPSLPLTPKEELRRTDQAQAKEPVADEQTSKEETLALVSEKSKYEGLTLDNLDAQFAADLTVKGRGNDEISFIDRTVEG